LKPSFVHGLLVLLLGPDRNHEKISEFSIQTEFVSRAHFNTKNKMFTSLF